MFHKTITKWLWLVASIITIGINTLAVLLPLNNQTTKEISDRLFTIITPAGFAFSIWSVIFTGLVIIGIIISQNQYNLTKKGLLYFLASCFLNCSWLFLWHYNFPIICGIVLPIIFIFNLLTYLELNRDKSNKLYTFVTSWYLIYVGWTMVASIISITIALKQLNFNGFGLSDDIWGSGIIFVASIISIWFSKRQRNVTTSLVLIWSLYAIYMNQSDTLIKGSSTLAIAILCISIAINIYKNKQLSKL
jgi:translocator protein